MERTNRAEQVNLLRKLNAAVCLALLASSAGAIELQAGSQSAAQQEQQMTLKENLSMQLAQISAEV